MIPLPPAQQVSFDRCWPSVRRALDDPKHRPAWPRASEGNFLFIEAVSDRLLAAAWDQVLDQPTPERVSRWKALARPTFAGLDPDERWPHAAPWSQTEVRRKLYQGCLVQALAQDDAHPTLALLAELERDRTWRDDGRSWMGLLYDLHKHNRPALMGQLWAACAEDQRHATLVAIVQDTHGQFLDALISPNPASVPSAAWPAMVDNYEPQDVDAEWVGQHAPLLRWLGPHMDLAKLLEAACDFHDAATDEDAPDNAPDYAPLVTQVYQLLGERLFPDPVNRATFVALGAAQALPELGRLPPPTDWGAIEQALTHLAARCPASGRFAAAHERSRDLLEWGREYAARKHAHERHADLATRPASRSRVRPRA